MRVHWITSVALFGAVLLSSNSFADLFNDGGVHNIDYTIERIVEYPEDDPMADPVIIQEGTLIIDRYAPGAHTTVNLLDGGHIIKGEVRIENQGCFNMYGGSVEWANVNVRDHGTFNMYNGTVYPWDISVWDDGVATIYDGNMLIYIFHPYIF